MTCYTTWPIGRGKITWYNLLHSSCVSKKINSLLVEPILYFYNVASNSCSYLYNSLLRSFDMIRKNLLVVILFYLHPSNCGVILLQCSMLNIPHGGAVAACVVCSAAPLVTRIIVYYAIRQPKYTI